MAVVEISSPQVRQYLLRIKDKIGELKELPYPNPRKIEIYNKEKGEYREFEYKSSHLRVYGITKKNGQIIILGGTKTKQSAEEKEFRSIKRKYLETL